MLRSNSASNEMLEKSTSPAAIRIRATEIKSHGVYSEQAMAQHYQKEKRGNDQDGISNRIGKLHRTQCRQ